MREGRIVDTIGSDHSPCTWDEETEGIVNICNAWGGISGLRLMLPALLTAGAYQHGLPLTDLGRILSTNPARLFGLHPQEDDILTGRGADLVVVNLDREWTLSADQLLFKNKHSSYVGCASKGMVERTLVRRVTVYLDGEIKVRPGFGQLLRRSYPYADKPAQLWVG